jgi:hypothetical protein
MKFSKEESFAKYAKGGTALHNIKMIPFFIQAIASICQKPEMEDYL